MQAETRARVNLKDLVFSAIEAVTESDRRLAQNTIDTIKKFSDNTGYNAEGSESLKLKTVQMVYDQIRHDSLDTLCAENVGLKVPVLSLVPLGGLKVVKSTIKFSTEVQEVDYHSGTVDIYTKVASGESERGDELSRIDFSIELASEPAAEGLARIVDQLSQNFIPKVLNNTPIDGHGNKYSDKEIKKLEKMRSLKKRENHLLFQLNRINELLRVKEWNNVQQEHGAENETEKTKKEHIKKLREINKHSVRKTQIENQLSELRAAIINLEMETADDENLQENNSKGDTKNGYTQPKNDA